MADVRRFASIVLVDPRGWVLLQERDEHPVIDPGCWGFVGGHVDRGEEPDAAAYRELAEETGLRVEPPALELWQEISIYHAAYESFDDVFGLHRGDHRDRCRRRRGGGPADRLRRSR